jgi:tricorn protease
MGSNMKGYYRFPTIHNSRIVFAAEEDLWIVDAKGGVARRLTANRGEVTHPLFSPDGEWIAFTGREEGHMEIYVMRSIGGEARRLTYLASDCAVAGWHRDTIIFASNYAQPSVKFFWLHSVGIDGNDLKMLPIGPAHNISYGEKGVVIGRNTIDPARWKRYRGGRAGEIWIDRTGRGTFSTLIDLDGNLANPMWIGKRIYFLSDHEGVGNIYSCMPDGSGLKAHTGHNAFYARNATTDGTCIVYHNGADIYLFDVKADKTVKVDIEYSSPRIQRNRKFVSAHDYLEDYRLSHDGSSLVFNIRGKSITLGNWEGPVMQQGVRKGVRYRLSRWLNDGKRLVTVSDEGGVEHIEIRRADGTTEPRMPGEGDIGRPYELKVSPEKDEIALSNHRHELLRVELDTGAMNVIDKSLYGPVNGFNWSPDGSFIAFSLPVSHQISIIKIHCVATGETYEVTDTVLKDILPVFDPAGNYLYFLSCRVFNPVYDRMHFDLNFPKGMVPHLVTLRKDVHSPFLPEPHGFEDNDVDHRGQNRDENKRGISIDFDGISNRIVPFPVSEGIYGSIAAAKNSVFYTRLPVEGARYRQWSDKEPPAHATVFIYDMKKLEERRFADKVTDFALSGDGTAMVYRSRNRLRVVKSGRDPKEELPKDEKPGRQSGWIDLNRVKISIDPLSEWKQMFREAWRLQRDYFWVEDMSGVNWEDVFKRYYPLVDRVASRREFSDLLWEMQGELGTSHAYEMGGDYRPKPEYKVGFLGADFSYDEKSGAYRFDHIMFRDAWDTQNPPPLARPGVNIKEGMLLLAVGGERLHRERPPRSLLVNRAGQEVLLTVAEKDGSSPRTVSVKTIPDETHLRYREWVERNREYVHKQSKGRAGYLHIPDMMADGYAEFHRYFLQEFDREGLIVDVRFNRGGHVSYLLLEKLARKRLGYDLTRWMGYFPYPEESVRGPIIALTNEYAGSDGDIFSHSFKLMKLGKLIGRRTWGGVVGIWPRNWLVDGTLTTQPEFSFWFSDVGWGVENFGTDPDIDVDITPQDYAKGRDTQLDRAIEDIIEQIEKNPPRSPDFSR